MLDLFQLQALITDIDTKIMSYVVASHKQQKLPFEQKDFDIYRKRRDELTQELVSISPLEFLESATKQISNRIVKEQLYTIQRSILNTDMNMIKKEIQKRTQPAKKIIT